tara:strand:- start:143 stop:436 length:294 start_codon:yes stop_codon:yes gene_type:complete
MFEPNTKVVCVNDVFPPKVIRVYEQLPVKDWVYEIRDVVPASDYGKGETIAVLLLEVVNRPNKRGVEHGFAHTRFRELTEEEQKQMMQYQQDVALAN